MSFTNDPARGDEFDTLKAHKLPPLVNSDRWEWGPRISNAFYLFARDASMKTTLFLYDRATKTREKLVSLDLTRYHVAPRGVGEWYATWSVCGPRTCNAFVRDTYTDLTSKIPAPASSPCRPGSTWASRCRSTTSRSRPTSGSRALAAPRSRATSTASATWARLIVRPDPAVS